MNVIKNYRTIMYKIGLIQAYLAVGKFKDAISTAKEAIATLPRSATAFCMMGKVLFQVPEGINEVRYIHTHTHIQTHTHAHTHPKTHTHTHKQKHTQTHTHTNLLRVTQKA
jgi:hypothetical protein